MMPGAPQQFLGPHSVNIFLTNLCNRRCPFCYLINWITNDEENVHHMTYKDLLTLISWLKRSNLRRVKLAGGEPTLHPMVIEFVEELTKNDVIVDGVLTNGLGESRIYEELADMADTNWLVNVGDPRTYSASEWELLNRNLEIMRWRNEDRSVKLSGFDTSSLRRLCLSITFYKPGQSFDYIIDLAKEHGCPVIRYDVSRPSNNLSNVYIDFDKLVGLKPTLMEFVRRCVREGIKPGVDDALPFCIFTQRELMYLYLFSNFYSICTPHSDVFPDLTVAHCTSMHGILPSYKIPEKTASQMFQELFSQASKYREIRLPRCEGCYNYGMSLCQGYCLRYKSDLLKPEEIQEEKRKPRIRWPRLKR
ncbi:MAG: radical SAM protein [Candidatus Bathyarchaeia archaeon]